MDLLDDPLEDDFGHGECLLCHRPFFKEQSWHATALGTTHMICENNVERAKIGMPPYETTLDSKRRSVYLSGLDGISSGRTIAEHNAPKEVREFFEIM